MGFTADDVAKLQAALTSGIQTIHFDGPPARTITFQNAQEIADVLKQARADVAAAENPVRYRFTKMKRGFDR